MFAQRTLSFKFYHVDKGIYLTSNNVIVEFWNFSNHRYAKVYHKSGLPIITLTDKPIKHQKQVLECLKPFLSMFNFNESQEQIRLEVETNEDLASEVMCWRQQIKSQVAL